MQRKIRRADETLVCVTTRYQGVLCSCRQRIYEGSVIYDYHCNESPWVFAQQIILSCISMNMLSQVEDITAMLLGISAHNAQHHRDRFIGIHCNKLHPVVLHYDCTDVEKNYVSWLCRSGRRMLVFLHFEFRLTISRKFMCELQKPIFLKA